MRIAPDMTVHVWDDERDVWIPLLDLAAAQREPVKLAVGAAFVAAMRPHDAPQAPAFMWLDASHANSEISAIEALLDAIARTDLQERFPQIIVTAPARRLTRTSFDRVVPVVEGVSEAPVASPAAARRLKAVGS